MQLQTPTKMGFVGGISFIGFFFLLNSTFFVFGNEEIKSHIVHIGARQHDDPNLVVESHQRMLESVFDSAEDARKAIIYNYHHGFSGFAARLTDSQAKKLSERSDVFQVAPTQKFKLLSTRVSEYLGLLPELPTGILHDSNMGHDLVVGIIDSGITPESKSYNDEGLGPIPKHWKGECVAGQEFDPAKHCNKKLVGAKYFFEGWSEQNDGAKLADYDYLSPRGYGIHGTFTSTIAASSFVPNVSVHGLAPGLMRGTAPKARIASYKVFFEATTGQSGSANIAKAFDEAIKDNCDVVSISVGTDGPYGPVSPSNKYTELALGAFHAVLHGIPVVAAAGNSGPEAYTVNNVTPWLLTVGATNLDRTFHSDMTFGNNLTITGQSRYHDKEVSGDLLYVPDWQNIGTSIKGKICLIFLKDDGDVLSAASAVMNEASGGIFARTSDNQIDNYFDGPMVFVDYEVGYEILTYMQSSSSPTVKISSARTLVGGPLATIIPGFSARGPNSFSPAILKPDVVAPGQTIVAAVPIDSASTIGYGFSTGTSMACPAVAGIVVLLKAVHPDWSPAALKSALMTTAWKTDPHGQAIVSEGNPRKRADPFDYGAGLVNAEKAKDPGLVYDMNLDDYIHYFCATGYNETAITALTGKPTKCGTPLPSILDLNYPAITIPDLNGEVTVPRTVTNVGPVASVYKAVIEPPKGIKIVVEPETLVFSSKTKILGYKVRVTTSHKSNTQFLFGSLTWTDGTHNVTIPLSVRTRVPLP